MGGASTIAFVLDLSLTTKKKNEGV